MYIKEKDLNEWEIQNGVISYGRLVDSMKLNMVSCDKIIEVDWECLYSPEYDYRYEECEKTGFEDCTIRDDPEIYDCDSCPYNYINCFDDFYQFFIIDIDYHQINKLRELEALLTILWSDELYVYILAVDHCGTSWYYISSGVTIDKAKEVGILY